VLGRPSIVAFPLGKGFGGGRESYQFRHKKREIAGILPTGGPAGAIRKAG
jgi:hypothetical protein